MILFLFLAYRALSSSRLHMKYIQASTSTEPEIMTTSILTYIKPALHVNIVVFFRLSVL